MSITAEACTLTSLLHQRPADVDVKSVLGVLSRVLHLPVSSVHGQRGEVVRVSLTVTEDRTHTRRVNIQGHVCSRSVQSSVVGLNLNIYIFRTCVINKK